MESPTGTPVDPVAIWSVALVAISGGIGLVWRALRSIRRIMRHVDEFMVDWNGSVARAGHSARPGVMERLAQIEHELKPNSGSSLRDAVNRIENNVTPPPG